MKSFKEFIIERVELREVKEDDNILQDNLKKELGLSSKDVSVKNTGTEIEVTILTMKGLVNRSKIENIGNKDQYNISTWIHWEFEAKLKKMIKAEFQKQLGDTEFNLDTRITLYKTFDVYSTKGKSFVSLKKEETQFSIIEAVPSEVLYLIKLSKDDSLYKKIK